ncbi:hypothetical protein AVEN_131334-1 [Araneus ventricosus]|uniref:Uncharacterized protein n=1 Tax=Araneus ventricosus TaxID=182803 RepID=A0A4Y2RQW5_ARAVE|nr:hypothetical protein AVEN_131334-1 [Araneus ventricosus]
MATLDIGQLGKNDEFRATLHSSEATLVPTNPEKRKKQGKRPIDEITTDSILLSAKYKDPQCLKKVLVKPEALLFYDYIVEYQRW